MSEGFIIPQGSPGFTALPAPWFSEGQGWMDMARGKKGWLAALLHLLTVPVPGHLCPLSLQCVHEFPVHYSRTNTSELQRQPRDMR